MKPFSRSGFVVIYHFTETLLISNNVSKRYNWEKGVSKTPNSGLCPMVIISIIIIIFFVGYFFFLFLDRFSLPFSPPA